MTEVEVTGGDTKKEDATEVFLTKVEDQVLKLHSNHLLKELSISVQQYLLGKSYGVFLK